MRLAIPIAIFALAAGLLAGCGDSSDGGTESAATTAPRASGSSAPAGATAKSCPAKSTGIGGLRATGLGCGEARQVMNDWGDTKSCAAPPGSSRSSCSLGPYSCLAAATDRGLMVSCARSGQSIAFTVKR